MIDPRRACPECLFQFDSQAAFAAARFCPHCGHDVVDPSTVKPMRLRIDGRDFLVGQPIQFGTTSNLYECMFDDRTRGVLKIARHPQSSVYISTQFDHLRRFHSSSVGDELSPFLPNPVACFQYQSGNDSPRRAIAMKYHDGIESPDELYSLEEVRTAYPNGIDARDMAWMYRRLLAAIGRVHEARHAHGQLTPDHILIEPNDHKLVLVGWGSAAMFGQPIRRRADTWAGWPTSSQMARPAVDISAAAISMRYLLADPIEPAIARHLERAAAGTSIVDAYRCLEDFDRLIEALWGARQFREFKMPPRHR